MERAPRLALIALLLVALPAATAGVPSAAVAVVDDSPAADRRVSPSTPDAAHGSGDRTDPGDATTVPATGPPPAAVGSTANGNDTLNRLELGSGDVTSSYGTPSPDLSGMVATGDGQLEASYQLYYYQYRLDNAANETERRRVVEEALSYSATRLERLRDQEAAAIRSYQNGSASTRDLLRELARIDAEAAAMRESLDEIKRHTDNTRRVGDIQRGLRSLESPIRERLGNGFSGEADATLVHVTATQDGLVIEMIDDEEYLREAVRLDNRVPGGSPTTFDLEERMTEFYPTAFPSPPSFRWDTTNDVQLFLVDFVVEQGAVTVYYDTGTEGLYREKQRLRVDRLSTTTVAQTTDDDIHVTVNRTDKGNPIRINVTESGEPVDATVRIDGQRVGTTGDDGVLWTLGPPGEYTISALTFRETTNVTVSGGSGQVTSNDGE